MGRPKFVDLVERVRPDAEALAGKIAAVARARFDHDPNAAHHALYELGGELLRVQAAADLFGRAAFRLKLKSIPKPMHFADPGPIMPELHFLPLELEIEPVVPWRAIQDLIERDPVFAASAEEVAQAYAQGNAFAVVGALDKSITKQVQDTLVEAFHQGFTTAKTSDLVQAIGGWSRAYAQTVVRTNATTAYVAGEFREARELEANGVIAGLRYQAILDSDARPNHKAAHGLVARVTDPIWNHLSPPLGYNCRCSVQPVDAMFSDVPVHARIPYGAHPDLGFGKGFGMRPDLAVYG